MLEDLPAVGAGRSAAASPTTPTLLYMLNHQNIFAQVNDGSRRRAVSQTFSPATSWFGLPPEHHLREVAEVPAVADDAVVARAAAR